jgi:hypothetical protein
LGSGTNIFSIYFSDLNDAYVGGGFIRVDYETDEFQSNEVGQSVESSGLESIGVLSKSQVSTLEAEKRKRENDKKESTTVFILNQREKLKGSQNKLAEQAAILQYRKNASQEFIKHEISEDELDDDFEPSTSDSCGILVNKKHY